MSKIIKSTQEKNRARQPLCYWYIGGFIIVTLFILIVLFFSFQDSNHYNRLKQIHFIPDQIGCEENNYTWVGHFDSDIKDDNLMFFLHYARMIIKVNDQEYGRYGYEKRAIGKSEGEVWTSFGPDQILSSDKIEIQIENVYGKDTALTADMLFDRIYTGDLMSLAKMNIKKSLLQIMIASLIIMIGILMIIEITTLHSMEMKTPKGYMLCGALMITGATCTLMDYDYISLIFSNTFAIATFDNITQLLIVEFLVLFMRTFIKNKIFEKFANLCVVIWTAMSILYFILQALNLKDGMEVADIYIPTAIILVMLVIILMIIDNHKSRNYLANSVIYSGIIVCFFTSIEMIYYFITQNFLIIFFQTGLLIFTIVQFVVMLQYIRDGQKQSKNASELEKELIQSRVAIMLSQIQPHFLYNSLGSISQLCTEDPQKAEIALDQFADFLRGNMSSLSCTKPIQFRQELKHLKNYIELEKIRFGDRIIVDYELDITDFKIPALTLQPIVENSIKHGITKRREGGTVTIKTVRKDDLVEIQIKDDGIGFDVRDINQDGRSHIGLENVRNRIEEMCHGKMSVISKPGIGTIVTIILKDEMAISME